MSRAALVPVGGGGSKMDAVVVARDFDPHTGLALSSVPVSATAVDSRS